MGTDGVLGLVGTGLGGEGDGDVLISVWHLVDKQLVYVLGLSST